LLAGSPGFVRSSEDGTGLDVSVLPDPGDPIAPAISDGSSIGAVAIDFATRRRNRVNGIVRPAASGFSIEVREAFGNCPKYTHAYIPLVNGRVSHEPPRISDQLDDRQKRWIEQAETLFLGTIHPDAGADASHRGGDPGFVRV